MLNINVEVNLKVRHLTYKSTMKQKIKLKEINGLLDKNPLDPDPAYFRIHGSGYGSMKKIGRIQIPDYKSPY